MDLPLGRSTETYTIFLSSDTTVVDIRDFVEDLVNKVMNPILVGPPFHIHLHVERWERTAAQRAPEDGVGALFVEKAVACDAILVLFQDTVGEGTRSELDAYLDRGKGRVCVVRCTDVPDPQCENDDVGQYLTTIKERVVYNLVHGRTSLEWPLAIFRILFKLVIDIIGRREEGSHHELR